MAEMKTPGQGQTTEAVAATSPQSITAQGSTPGAGKKASSQGASGESLKQKTQEAAETVREKTHEFAESARSGIEQAKEAIEKAPDYAHKAEEFIRTAEQRLDELINTAEKVLAKGTEYTGLARSWMNDHPEYRRRAEKIISKANEYRDRLGQKASERSAAKRAEGGESPAEHLRSQGHEAVEKGKEALERGMEKGKEVFEKGRERLRGGVSGASMSNGVSRASTFVRNNPTDTLLVGTAIGVIVGTVVKHSRSGVYGV